MIIRLAGMSVRQGCLLGLLMCALMMGVALVLQYVYGLTPCPLCIGQRIAVLLAAFVFAIGALHNPAGNLGRGLYAGLAALASAKAMPRVMYGCSRCRRRTYRVAGRPDYMMEARPGCTPGAGRSVPRWAARCWACRSRNGRSVRRVAADSAGHAGRYRDSPPLRRPKRREGRCPHVRSMAREAMTGETTMLEDTKTALERWACIR